MKKKQQLTPLRGGHFWGGRGLEDVRRRLGGVAKPRRLGLRSCGGNQIGGDAPSLGDGGLELVRGVEEVRVVEFGKQLLLF